MKRYGYYPSDFGLPPESNLKKTDAGSLDVSSTCCYIRQFFERSLDADLKLIAAYHAILLCALRALDDLLHGGSVMQTVTVVTQSEAILQDPSNYWISVINAGRHFSLDEVMGEYLKICVTHDVFHNHLLLHWMPHLV